MTDRDPAPLTGGDRALAAALLIALTAPLGALSIGEVVRLLPCTLC